MNPLFTEKVTRMSSCRLSIRLSIIYSSGCDRVRNWVVVTGRARTAMDKFPSDFQNDQIGPYEMHTARSCTRTAEPGSPAGRHASTTLSSCVVSANAYVPYQGRIVRVDLGLFIVTATCPPANRHQDNSYDTI